jgi:hypothetical protein
MNVVGANKLVNGVTETNVIVVLALILGNLIKNLENLHCENEYEKNKYG